MESRPKRIRRHGPHVAEAEMERTLGFGLGEFRGELAVSLDRRTVRYLSGIEQHCTETSSRGGNTWLSISN